MNNIKKQEISKIIIKLLKSRFDTFPSDDSTTRNAPFHKAFLQAFSEKFDEAGTNVDAMISMSSWTHGLNTTLGQMFFESVAHILCDGEKRSFYGSEYKIHSDQERIIAERMTDLKNGTELPNVIIEDELIAANATGRLVVGTNFTADCYFEDEDKIVAIELKSVRPNSGETRGEKQKILKAKAALRLENPTKRVQYFFGFPFDPTANTDTGYDKARFMSNMIEFSKFVDQDEILIAEELWSYLSGEAGTMQELLELIRCIATSDFLEEYSVISNPENLFHNVAQYKEIAEKWGLIDEVRIATSVNTLVALNNRIITRNLNLCAFDTYGNYNERRASILLG